MVNSSATHPARSNCCTQLTTLFLLLLLTLAVDTSTAAEVAADDWPFVRGPNFDGHSAETQLADEWPDQGPPVLWTRTLGQGYSSFVAWDEWIATQYQTLGGQYVVCLAAETGKTIWEHRYDWPYDPAGVYPGPRATPTYADGRLYFASPTGLVRCLKADSGEPLWSVNINERFAGQGTEFGYSCSPTVVDHLVLLPVGGAGASMVALDALDGSVVWQAGSEPASYTPAYPIEFGGRDLVLGYLQNSLVCHDRHTGQLVWRHKLSVDYDEHSAWPIYREPYLWLSGPFRAGSQLLELTGDPKEPLKLVWTSEIMSNDIASSVLVEGRLYGFDVHDIQAKVHRPTRGQFRAVDFLTGEPLWSFGNPKESRRLLENDPKADQRTGHATVIAADGKLILLNDTGELILLRANPQRYEELGRVSVLGGEICWTQPTLHRGRLFVRNQSRAVCLHLGSPDKLSEELLASAVTVAEIPQGKYVDVAELILGIEPEYAFDLPSDQWLWRWYWISAAGIVGASLLIVTSLHLIAGNRLSVNALRAIFWSIAFVLGAIGTPLLSRGLGEFVFTWQVCLFVPFQALVYELRLGGESLSSTWARWRGRVVALLFVACCLGYFLLCRRLSLVFEWVFLCGFAGAVPFALAGSLCFANRNWRLGWEAAMTIAAYSSFYWSAAAILWWKSG